MAQTCRTWQRIVYRKSVWAEKNVQYRRHSMLILDKVPARARHIGTPTQFCFLHWLKEKSYIAHGRSDPFPVHILHISDPKMFLKAAHGYWKRNGCPCVVHEHHKLQDLMRMPFPASFSKTDKQRVLCRLLETPSCGVRNVYNKYLECQTSMLGSTLGIAPIGIIPDTSDPLHRYIMEVHTTLQTRMEAINAATLTKTAVYQSCISALARRGHSEFTINDTWYARERDAAWSIAGFVYKKSTA